MDLREQYHALCDAGLYAFGTHERHFGLPAVDHLLVPYARARLTQLRGLIDSADHRGDLADDAYAVAEFTYRYLQLRRDLHADFRHRQADAGWRVIPRFTGGFGVRALPGDPSGAAALVLRPAPSRHDARGWELTRIDGGPARSGPPAATTWTVTLPAEEHTNIGVIHAPADLESDEALFAHLLTGLAAVTKVRVRRAS